MSLDWRPAYIPLEVTAMEHAHMPNPNMPMMPSAVSPAYHHKAMPSAVSPVNAPLMPCAPTYTAPAATGPVPMSASAILVLFILLVIITRTIYALPGKC